MFVLHALVLCACFVVETESCQSLSRFIRDRHLDNMMVAAESSAMTPLTLRDCAQECNANVSCLSFLHNQGDGGCLLMSRIHVTISGDTIQQGNIIHRKHIDGSVCNMPKFTNNGEVLYIDGLVEGSKAVVLCDDHSPAEGVCDVTGTWTGLDDACLSDNASLSDNLMTSINVDVDIFADSCLTIVGVPTDDDTRFKINFKEEGSANNLQFAVKLSDQTILRNSYVNDAWGVDETVVSHWPLFLLNQEFTISFCTGATQYTIGVDGTEVCTYIYRSPLSNIRRLTTSTGLGVKQVIYSYSGSDTILL